MKICSQYWLGVELPLCIYYDLFTLLVECCLFFRFLTWLMPEHRLSRWIVAVIQNKSYTCYSTLISSKVLQLFPAINFLSPVLWVVRVLEPVPAVLGWTETGVTPWTGRQFITKTTQRDKPPSTLTPADNSELPISLMCMSLDCGGKWENLMGADAGTRRA